MPVLDCVSEVYAELGSRWKPLLRALFLPATILAVGQALRGEEEGFHLLAVAMVGVDLCISAVLAVSVHRIILLGNETLPNRWGLYFTGRELRFVGWTLVPAGIAMLCLLPAAVLGVVFIAMSPPARGGIGQILTVAVIAVASVPALVLAFRASLALPAVALDQRPSLKGTLSLSRGHVARLIAVLLLPQVPFIGLGVLQYVLGDPPGGAIAAVAVSAIMILTEAVGIASLSVAFRRLVNVPGAVAA